MIFSIFNTTEYQDRTSVDIFKNLNHYHSKVIKGYQTIEYTMKEDFRPEEIAYELYGDSSLYWVIFLINNKVDPFYDWIVTPEASITSTIDRYQWVGGENNVHHHTDENGRWWYDVVEDPDNPRNWYNIGDWELNAPEEGQPDNRQLLYHGVMIPVSVAEYEFNKNERNRTIEILTPQDMKSYVSDFLIEAGV